MACRHRIKPTGFTLMEIMVALAIISIALLAALRAAGQGTANVDELRARLFAGWVAENRLAEYRARQQWLQPGIRRGTDSQGGIEFGWREEVTTTPNPSFRRVDIYVHTQPAESRTLAHLAGFIVLPPGSTQ